MRLSRVVIEMLPVDVGGINPEPFYVRGLGLSDFQRIMSQHGTAMRALFDKFIEARNEGMQWSANEVGGLLMQAIGDAPDLVAYTIATAANDIEGVEIAGTLSIGIQADALMKIWGLSIKQDAQLKNLQELIFGSLGKLASFADASQNTVSTVGSLN